NKEGGITKWGALPHGDVPVLVLTVNQIVVSIMHQAHHMLRIGQVCGRDQQILLIIDIDSLMTGSIQNQTAAIIVINNIKGLTPIGLCDRSPHLVKTRLFDSTPFRVYYMG